MTRSRISMVLAIFLGTLLSISACSNRNERGAGTARNDQTAPSDTSRGGTDESKKTETYGQPGEIGKDQKVEKGSAKIETQKRVTKTEKETENIPTVESKNVKADINRLSTDEFQKLGLPRSVAENVTKYRDDHGKFNSVDELKQVPGMNMSWLDKMHDQLGVG